MQVGMKRSPFVTTAAQIFLSWGHSRSQKDVLPRIKIFCGKIDFSWNFFPGKWNEMLSLVTDFISASVSVACGLPRKPVQLVRGMHHPLCLAGGILEWTELILNGGSKWVHVGGSYGLGWKGAGWPGQNAMSYLGIRFLYDTSESTCVFLFFFFSPEFLPREGFRILPFSLVLV